MSMQTTFAWFVNSQVILYRLDSSNSWLATSLDGLRLRDRVWAHSKSTVSSEYEFKRLQRLAGSALEASGNLPRLVISAMMGDLQVLESLLAPDLVDYRHGDIGTPLMHFPVLGFKHLRADRSRSLIEKRKKVIDFLFDQGLRLDARDLCGYTAVMYAAGGPGSQPELLKHLLTKGADPNIKSIYGSVALTDASMINDHQAMGELSLAQLGHFNCTATNICVCMLQRVE